jgi:hypothetical protein
VKIVEAPEPRPTTFGDLNPGDAFKSQGLAGVLWMKTDGQDLNAVDLADGMMTVFLSGVEVFPRHGAEVSV